MNIPLEDQTALDILAFLGRHYPYETEPLEFETRNVICGELRLALHEYDAACGELIQRRLIQTDPPQAHDCDSIALTTAGRRTIGAPPLPGGLAWRILQFLCAQEAAAWQPANALLQAGGVAAPSLPAYLRACQTLYDWGYVQRTSQPDQPQVGLYGRIAPTQAGQQAVQAKSPAG